jgi:gluconate 2-dehydrogenase gamma chain
MEPTEKTIDRSRLTRGRFIGRAGAAALTLGLVACGEEQPSVETTPDVNAAAFPPLPPSHPLICGLRTYFTAQEHATVDAFSARLIPGSAADPGARESCVVTYIDNKLAEFETFATPTYFGAPFAKPLKTGAPPPDQVSKKTILVAAGELYRYGFQGSQTPQEAYRAGIAQLDAYSNAEYGSPFLALNEATQDTVIGLLDDSNPENPPSKKSSPAAKKIQAFFKKPSAYGFFSMVQNDTNEGMFADPVYGGNRDFAGWKLIGYPGAQRAWTPEELRNGPNKRRVQGLRMLMPQQPGKPAPGTILPLSRSQEG